MDQKLMFRIKGLQLKEEKVRKFHWIRGQTYSDTHICALIFFSVMSMIMTNKFENSWLDPKGKFNFSSMDSKLTQFSPLPLTIWT